MPYVPETSPLGRGQGHTSPIKTSSPMSFSASQYLDWTLDEKKMIHIPTEIAGRVSLLYRAIEAGDESSVNSMLTLYQELDPNSPVPGLSMPLLHLAVGLSENHPEIVNLLLERGGDPNNLTTEDKVSPLHLAVIYDYETVLHALIGHGGDPTGLNGDGKSCYDLAKDNVEEEMKEKCFLYFYRRSVSFRKSIKPSDSIVRVWKDNHSDSLSLSELSLSDGDFVTCESDFEPVESVRLEVLENETKSINVSAEERKLWDKYSYLMTEDESDSSRDEDGKKLSTIEEESALTASYQRQLGYEETRQELCNSLSAANLSDFTVPLSCASAASDAFDNSRSTSASTMSSEPTLSFANSTPPILPPPSKNELATLQTMIQNNPKITSPIPITPSTFQVLNRFAKQDEDQAKLVAALAPKSGSFNFTSELKLAITNLHIIDEWGNLKIDLLHSLSTPSKKSKSFYNYLLLDPKVTKRVNFSGTHLKSTVINNPEKFETFLKSVFYIGKGCGKRPIQHLVDAKAKYGTGRSLESNSKKAGTSCGEKIDRILNIWKSGLGVIVVSVFHHSSEREANVNEAAMIDAVGLMELSNIKKGSYAGTLASSWNQKTKNQFGSFLLYKSFCAFAVSQHKSFYPQDI